MAIKIVPIIPTKQIAVSNTQLCILLWRPFKAQENVYVSPNEEKSVTSTKCGKNVKSAARGKKLLLVASAISSTNGTKSGKMCKEYIVCV